MSQGLGLLYTDREGGSRGGVPDHSLLALGYHYTHLTGDRNNVRALAFANGIEAARRLVPELRRSAEAIVVVSHQGSKVDRKLLQEIEGIDLVVGAHSHDLITPPERVGGGWLVQAMSDGTMLGEVTLEVRDGRVTDVSGTVHVLWADRFHDDPGVASIVAELRAPHREQLEEVLATSAERIGRQYKSESPFDKLVGRVLREETGTELAFLPGVGYGVSLMPGPITREALARLLPHPSKIAMLTLTGAQIREVLEQSAANQAPNDPLEGVGGLIQTDGIVWSADLRRPVGQRVGEVLAGESPIDPARRYRAVVSAAMLDGLHKYETFARAENVKKLDRSISDIVEGAFREAGKVWVPPMGDIMIQKANQGK